MKQFWQENKGSISILATLSIVSVLMILLLSINIGNIYAKKNLVEDTADAIAPVLLTHQIKAYLDEDNPYTGTQNPTDVANDILSKISGISGATPTIIFGVVNDSTVNSTLTTGFYDFNTSESGNNTNTLLGTGDDRLSNPNLGNVTLVSGQDFAIAFRLTYSPQPLGDLVTFDPITLKGYGMYQTNIALVESEVDPVDKKECCCTELAGGTTIPFFMMGGGCKVPEGGSILEGTIFEFPKTESCLYIIPNSDPICDDFYMCQGTFWSNLLTRTAFSSFWNLFKCWFDDFITRLIQSIQTVDQAIQDSFWASRS
ncbi:MAG: hypothetical protein PF442_02570 [Desulfobulbaceae bacterium]|jgi:Flp pilus assembly protein TadG|nr:hypothetical protein [Desulfobulbaceae bacterium]